jgi:hypothetical protein
MSRINLCLLLVAVVLLTRGAQFVAPSAPPDATLAAMFLGGLWLQRAVWCAPILIAALAADAIAIYGFSVPGDCLSAAYLALVPICMLAWSAGWAAQRSRMALWQTAALALLACSIAFVLSNAAWYLLSEDAARLPAPAFLHGLVRWYPAYALSPVAYVLGAVALARRYRAQAAHPA